CIIADAKGVDKGRFFGAVSLYLAMRMRHATRYGGLTAQDRYAIIIEQMFVKMYHFHCHKPLRRISYGEKICLLTA
ncbi:MAG: hypothetical protein IJR81_01640, partial [Clostridia bacterium]|nr:hypothetical protein [Clostridia bacterium]